MFAQVYFFSMLLARQELAIHGHDDTQGNFLCLVCVCVVCVCVCVCVCVYVCMCGVCTCKYMCVCNAYMYVCTI